MSSDLQKPILWVGVPPTHGSFMKLQIIPALGRWRSQTGNIEIYQSWLQVKLNAPGGAARGQAVSPASHLLTCFHRDDDGNTAHCLEVIKRARGSQGVAKYLC